MYSNGRYLVGPDYTFKKFQKTAHFVKLRDLVFTKDKVEVGWNYCSYLVIFSSKKINFISY